MKYDHGKSIPALLLIATLGTLAACGGGGGSSGGGGVGGSPSPAPVPTPTPTPAPAPAPTPQSFTIGGTLAGLEGTGLVLQDNSGDDLPISANGSFTFATQLADGTSYSVSLKTPPSYPAQDCSLTNATGTASANVATIAITCSNLPLAAAYADAGVKSATVTWSNSAAQTANLYISSARDCDVRNYAGCPDGAMVSDIPSLQAVGNLVNGRPYYFQVESVFASGARGLSRVFGARPNVLAFDGAVSAIAARNDGTVYVGGNFTRVGVVTGGAVPLDLDAGRLAHPDFPLVVGTVNAIEPDGQGGWFLGGTFQAVGGEPRNNLAHVRADHTLDPNWNPGADGTVWALAYVGSTLYVGGSFTVIGNSARPRLVALDASGAPTAWNPSPNNTVWAIKASRNAIRASDNSLYVGGAFTLIGVNTRNHLAAFDANGNVTAWDPDADEGVFTLETSGNGVYAGGLFAHVRGAARIGLAEINDAGAVTAWDPGTDGTVYTIAATSSAVYVGGLFTTVHGAPRNSLAAIDRNGAVMAWNPRPSNYVDALKVVGDTVYVAGQFSTIGGASRSNLAAIDSSGAATAWNPDADAPVNALGLAGGADLALYAGGQFNALGAAARGQLAQLDATGALTAWNPNLDGDVLALAIADDVVYVGGLFERVGTEYRRNLAAIDANGNATLWNPEPNRAVNALLNVRGQLIVGGSFTTLYGGNVTLKYLASFDSNGKLNFGFTNLGGSPDETVNALAASDAGPSPTIYVGGSFTHISNSLSDNFRPCLAAFGTDGSLKAWSPSPDYEVKALVVSGGLVYVGGSFNMIGSKSRPHLAAIGADGFATDWNPAADRDVIALGVSGNTIYAAGWFTHIGGAQRNYLAALDPTGAATSWAPVADADLFTLVIEGSRVYVGGRFISLSNSPRSGFGVINVTGTGTIE